MVLCKALAGRGPRSAVVEESEEREPAAGSSVAREVVPQQPPAVSENVSSPAVTPNSGSRVAEEVVSAPSADPSSAVLTVLSHKLGHLFGVVVAGFEHLRGSFDAGHAFTCRLMDQLTDTQRSAEESACRAEVAEKERPRVLPRTCGGGWPRPG